MKRKKVAKRFKVEHNYTYGWDDAGWTMDRGNGEQIPWRFDSRGEAQAEIDMFIKDIKYAVHTGHMKMGYNKSEFRVVEA